QYENQTAPKSGGSKKRKKAADPASSAPDRGWMTILGTCLAAVGGIGLLATLGEAFAAGAVGFLPYLADVFPLMGFVGVGTALVYAGIKNTRKRKRYRKYLALIGKRESVSITALAQTLSVSVKTACNDLQGMLDDGVLRVGYVDLRRDRLVLTADGMADEEPEEPAPAQTKDEDAYLQEIKAVNDDIEDDEMNRKIDRIGEITGKILDYQRNNPNKAGGMRSFLNYYLPTTLKILHAYAQLEAQGIEGENITLAKDRIEGMMDKVVEGFEKQLDKLFQGDALDITSDVAVLEKMLDSDGLSGGDGMTMTL
ncbi:MAG: 5-bromo-4-chloroindolyl phosphate hydrolysis family protein, partial [Oscillospiraceae bacterium]